MQHFLAIEFDVFGEDRERGDVEGSPVIRGLSGVAPTNGWSSIVDSPHVFGDWSVCGHVVEIVFVVEEAAEGGFTARAVGDSIFTEGNSLEELRANVRSAVECHFEEGKAPKVIRLHIVRDEILAP